MRLFIAINFNEEVKNKLDSIITDLKSQALKGNFTRKENLHLTVVFLGETTRVDTVKQAMDSIVAAPFTLKVSGLGSFPRQGGNIYWLGIAENNMLINIYKQLHKTLSKSGFELEQRRFKPHLTLGREVIMKNNFNSYAFAQRVAPMNIEVAKISLMKSERVAGKLTYTTIYTKELEI